MQLANHFEQRSLSNALNQPSRSWLICTVQHTVQHTRKDLTYQTTSWVFMLFSVVVTTHLVNNEGLLTRIIEARHGQVCNYTGEICIRRCLSFCNWTMICHR